VNSYEKFKKDFLTDLAKPGMGDERHFRSFALATQYAIPHNHVREVLLQWASEGLIGLRAWDGSRVRDWREWANHDDMFFASDGGYVRINILAAGSALVEDLPKRLIGFAAQ
jgi:DNA-binding GntR family transcriptional regulator